MEGCCVPDDIHRHYKEELHAHTKTIPLLLLSAKPCVNGPEHRLKLVIGVDISRRDDSSDGNEVCVCSSRRSDNAERKTRLRRLEGVRWIEVIELDDMGYCRVCIQGRTANRQFTFVDAIRVQGDDPENCPFRRMYMF